MPEKGNRKAGKGRRRDWLRSLKRKGQDLDKIEIPTEFNEFLAAVAIVENGAANAKINAAVWALRREYIKADAAFRQSYSWLRDRKQLSNPYFRTKPAMSYPQRCYYSYNAITTDEGSHVLCEGPCTAALAGERADNSTLDMSQAFKRYILDEHHISVVIAVGPQSESNNGSSVIHYDNYFLPGNQYSKMEEVSACEFFKLQSEHKLPMPEEISIKFYKVLFRGRPILVIHLPDWQDGEMYDFSSGDIQILTYIAKFVPRFAIHSSLSLSRAPALLAALILIEQQFEITGEALDVTKQYNEIVNAIRSKKPMALSDFKMYAFGLFIVMRMQAFIKCNQHIFADNPIPAGLTRGRHFGGDRSKPKPDNPSSDQNYFTLPRRLSDKEEPERGEEVVTVKNVRYATKPVR